MPGTKCISQNPRKPGSSRRETALRNACIPLEKGHRYADARLSVSSVLSRRSEKFPRQFPHDAAALSSFKLETGSTRVTAPSVAGCVPEIGLLAAEFEMENSRTREKYQENRQRKEKEIK